MRAWEYDRYGKSDVMVLREVPVPVAGPGQLVVRVRAAALNPKDGLFRRGTYKAISGQSFPKKLGADWVGEVVSVGPNTRGFSIGDRAWGCLVVVRMKQGTLAEYALVDAEHSAPLVAPISDIDAAGMPLAAQTSLQALRDIASVRAGERVLIHGASGGVGVFAIQIAKALGAYVITTSSEANFDLCRSLGADETLDYHGLSFAAVRPPVHVFFDAVGNQSLGAVRGALGPIATYVTTVPTPTLVLDAARSLVSPVRARLVVIQSRTRDLELIDAWVRENKLHAVVDSTFGFEQVHEAFARLESRRARGKIIVTISPDVSA